MLENAIDACPEALGGDDSQRTPFWYLVSHTLFWLDFYLTESPERFTPPAPFGLEEMDPAGVMPPRVYTKRELRTYLNHGREKCRRRIEALTDESARRRFRFGRMDMPAAELLLYNLRHVQHGAAQLNFILRQKTDSAPRWVGRVDAAPAREDRA
jgi:hypothetical protein